MDAESVKSHSLNCPKCRAVLDIKLTYSQSIVCSTCNCLIDLTEGTGDHLSYVEQDQPANPIEPLIPLGSRGSLQNIRWQVVGFLRDTGSHMDATGKLHYWDIYYLFNNEVGFAFLVDIKSAWLLLKPASDVPVQQSDKIYQYAGTSYAHQLTYEANKTYALGEFHQQVQLDQRIINTYHAENHRVLLSEEIGQEVTWLAGVKVGWTTVAGAFGQFDNSGAFHREADRALPTWSSKESHDATVFWFVCFMSICFCISAFYMIFKAQNA